MLRHRPSFVLSLNLLGDYFLFLGKCCIVHRLLLRENLRKAHRKHAYQLMANELKMGHLKVSLLYMALQLVVSLGFIFLCPNTPTAHWWYLIGASLVLCLAYVALVRCKVYNVRGLEPR